MESKLQNFEILNKLGSGAYSSVFVLQHLFIMRMQFHIKNALLRITIYGMAVVYTEGGDLLQKIQRYVKIKQMIPELEIWQVGMQVLQGFRALHHKKILHRDLKCANIFLYENGHVELGDFNVSKMAKNGLVYTQTGTPYYASPEVWQDKPYDHKADLRSLGCVVNEMCALKPNSYSHILQLDPLELKIWMVYINLFLKNNINQSLQAIPKNQCNQSKV
ncbi:unnamed protein product [Paramecium octaurelia]|uniref:non-specific serine/threonine protein kinase n=1 Tax=Paramecium octaurelia TaxID=43137 RepID=A0A8S1T7T8_PAROT|nr:unnamed protein product [Paramecium octaurelia]